MKISAFHCSGVAADLKDHARIVTFSCGLSLPAFARLVAFSELLQQFCRLGCDTFSRLRHGRLSHFGDRGLSRFSHSGLFRFDHDFNWSRQFRLGLLPSAMVARVHNWMRSASSSVRSRVSSRRLRSSSRYSGIVFVAMAAV